MSIIQTIHHLEQTVSAAFRDGFAAAGHNITPCQFMVLRAVCSAPGASQTKIVDVTGVDRSTLADVVRRLIKSGLLMRHRHRQDARTYELKCTNEGEAIVEIGNNIEQKIEHLASSGNTKALEKVLQVLNSSEEFAEAA